MKLEPLMIDWKSVVYYCMCCFGLALFAGPLARVEAQIDTVVKLDGTRVAGKLLEMTATSINIERNRVSTTIPVQEIDHIRFSDDPQRMNQVREAIKNRQYEVAAKELSTMSWEGLRPETILDGTYYSARVKAELALAGVPGHTMTEAVTLLRRFQEGGKNHFQYNRAMLLYGQLAFSSDRLPLAIETFQGLTSVPDQMIALQASVDLGNAQLLQKQFSEAAQALQKAASSDLSDPMSLRLKQTAKILGHVAAAGTGDVEAAVAAIEAIIANENPEDVYINAIGYNAIGRLRMNTNQTRDAELAYLHTELLFAANPQAHPEALYHLVKIWTDSGKTDRASEARDKLKNRYGGTYWSQKLSN